MRVLLTILTVIVTTSCGHYYEYYDEYETEVSYSYTSGLRIDAHWHADSYDPYYYISYDADLDLELKDPFDDYVTPYTPTFGECEHFGDDYGYSGTGIESLDCYYPYPGVYKVRLVNLSEYWQTVDLNIRIETEEAFSSVEDVTVETFLIPPYGVEVSPVVIY